MVASAASGAFSGWIGGPGANHGKQLSAAIKHTRNVVAREARRANRKYAAKKTAQALFKRKNTLETAALFGSAGFVFTNEVSNIITNTYEGVKNWIIETFW